MVRTLLFLTLAFSVACGDDEKTPENTNNPNNSASNNPQNNPPNNQPDNSQNPNNPQPPTTRNAQATIEIDEGDFAQPLAFSTALPTGTYNMSSDSLYLLNLAFSTVSEDPEITITLVFADAEKPVEPGEYVIVTTPGAGVFGALSVGGEGYFGVGNHQTGSATLDLVEDGTISGTKLVSGTFSVEGTLDWTNGKEGQSEFKALTGTFTNVPVTILP